MKWRWSRLALLIPGLVLLVGIVAIHIITGDVHVNVTVTMVGLGTVLLAIAALWTAAIKFREYVDRVNELETKTDDLDSKFNGGMAQVMAQVLNDEIQSGNFQVELVRRVAELEERDERNAAKYAECVERAQDCEEREREWRRLKDRITHFLDSNGEGRSEPREAPNEPS